MVVCRVYVFSSPMDFKLCISIMLCLEAATPEQRPTHHTRARSPPPSPDSPLSRNQFKCCAAIQLSSTSHAQARRAGGRGTPFGTIIRCIFSVTRFPSPVSLSRLARGRAPRAGLRVTVWTLLTRYTIPVRRSGGYLSTPWYQPRCVMVRTRPARRHADVISIQRSCRPGVRHASA